MAAPLWYQVGPAQQVAVDGTRQLHSAIKCIPLVEGHHLGEALKLHVSDLECAVLVRPAAVLDAPAGPGCQGASGSVRKRKKGYEGVDRGVPNLNVMVKLS